jgi:protein-disulfide isomerase
LLAEGSACANEQDRFWEFHDMAFETKGKISQAVLMDIALTLDLDLEAFQSCLASDRGLRIVQEDINAAINAGVRSTPTLFINGRGLSGVPKPWMLNEILNFSKKNLAPPK